MNEKFQGACLALLVALSIIAAAYFFSLTGIEMASFTTINLLPLFEKIITINFGVFLLLASAAIGLILAIGKKCQYKYALATSMIGSLIGTGVSFFLFPATLAFFLPALFLLIGIPLGIKYLDEKEKEMKYLPHLRSGISGAGRIIIAISLGFFLFLLVTDFTMQKQLEDGFMPGMLTMTLGPNQKITLDEQFTNQLAGQIAKSNADTISQIQLWPSVTNLVAKNDPDGVDLANNLAQYKAAYSSQGTIDKLSAQLRSNNIEMGTQVMKQMPVIEAASKYAWIIYAVEAFFITMLFGSLIVKNLSALWYSLVMKLAPQRTELTVSQQIKAIATETNKNG